MTPDQLRSHLPYSSPFLFVDEILSVDEHSCTGVYTYAPESDFYRGHFKDNPITPGVILIETMAQIGLVSLGLFLIREEIEKGLVPQIAFTSSEVDFFLPVMPGERVTVVSEKKYFRFNKLKCDVQMLNESKALVCRGQLSGMLRHEK